MLFRSKRLKSLNKKICIATNIFVKHLAGKSHDPNYSNKMEIQRNWHYMWSLFYFNKKHNGSYIAYKITIGKFLSMPLHFHLVLQYFGYLDIKIF